MIHKRLSELQAECISTREEIGKVKAQKEEAERQAAQATQAAKAAAQAAKSANPPTASGTSPNPEGNITDFSTREVVIEAEAAEEAIIRPRVMMSVISVGDKDTGQRLSK